MNRPSDSFLVRVSFLPAAVAIGFGILCDYARYACDVSFAGVVANAAMALGGIPYWISCKRHGHSTRGAKYLVFVGATPVALFALLVAVIVAGT